MTVNWWNRGGHVQVHRTGQVDPSRHCSEHCQYLEKKDEYQEITAYLVGGEPGDPKDRTLHSAAS